MAREMAHNTVLPARIGFQNFCVGHTMKPIQMLEYGLLIFLRNLGYKAKI